MVYIYIVLALGEGVDHPPPPPSILIFFHGVLKRKYVSISIPH